MEIFFWILLAIIVFFSVVIFHELGHFLAARKFGVKVEEFGIGIPPKALTVGKDRHGCEYTLNYLPIGGFVRLKGEDSLSPDGKHLDAFSSKGYFARSCVILAGVVFNFIFAFVLFTFLFVIGVQPLAINSKFETSVETRLIPSPEKAIEIGLLKVSGIELTPIANSPAEIAGIRAGDRVVSVGGKEVTNPKKFVDSVKEGVSPTGTLSIQVTRNGSPFHFEVPLRDGKIGSYVSYADSEIDKEFKFRYSFPDAVKAGAEETYAQTAFTFEMLGKLVKKLTFPVKEGDRQEAVAGVGWPIAIGGLFVDLVSAKVAVSVIIVVAALLSINLGAFNLLPLPALDGGRFFLMTVVEPFLRLGKVRTVRKIESAIHSFGFLFFMLLAVIVALHDVSKFFK